MVDWPGLLKWTLAHSDGTAATSEFKPMSEEDKKFLQEAFEHYTLDESKRMRELVEEITKPETAGDKAEEDKRAAMVDELSELVEGLENARDLVRMGIYQSLVKLMLNSVHAEVRKGLYFLFASCNGNNTFVQDTSMQLGGFNLLNAIIKEKDLSTKEATFAALSSLVRGESLPVKRRFIDIEGVEFLLELLRNDKEYNSNKIRTKVVTLLNDLVFYDDKLDYQDIIAFNKSGGSEVKVDNKPSQHISLSKNEESKSQEKADEAQKPSEDLARYKNIVKEKLIAQDFLSLGLKYVNKENLKQLSDFRAAYFALASTLIEYRPSSKPSKEYFNKISEFAMFLDQENKGQDNFYESEMKVLNRLLSLE